MLSSSWVGAVAAVGCEWCKASRGCKQPASKTGPILAAKNRQKHKPCEHWSGRAREFAATQYALFSSAYSFFCKLMASTTSGPLAEAVGWTSFYLVTATYTVPSIVLIVVFMRYAPDIARGIRR